MTSVNDRFPPNLLQEANEVRKKYFRDKIINHNNLKIAQRILLKTIRNSNLHPNDPSIIIVYGPTGVGKTTLANTIVETLIIESIEEMKNDLGFIPVVKVLLDSPAEKNFDWKQAHIAILEAFQEPMINKKIGDDQLWGITYRFMKNSSKVEINTAVKNCLLNRRPKALILDEAQHIKKLGSGRKLIDQMDYLKSLAESSKTTIVLFGTYDLLDLTKLNCQLARRCKEVHLSRYQINKKQDRQVFNNVLGTFERHLPLANYPEIFKNQKFEYFYERSLGCVGILKKWLEAAYSDALESEEQVLTKEILDFNSEPTGKLIHMALEITNGEQMLVAPSMDELREILKCNYEEDKPDKSKEEISQPGKPKNNHVAIRNPVRDPIGVVSNEN